MDKHYIFNIGYLTHTPFPEIALGLLFLVATVILIYKFVSMVKTGKSSPKEISSAQDKNTAVEKEAAPYQFIDLRKKIEGFWRGVCWRFLTKHPCLFLGRFISHGYDIGRIRN